MLVSYLPMQEMPVVISTGGDMTSNTLNNDWTGTFDKEITYWETIS